MLRLAIVFVFAIAAMLVVGDTPVRVDAERGDDARPGTRCTRFGWPPKVSRKKAVKKTTLSTAMPGSRCSRFDTTKRVGKFLPNQAPFIELGAPLDGLTAEGDRLRVKAYAWDPDGDQLLYTFSTTGGRVSGDGPEVTWDLSGARSGTYTITAETDDGCGCVAFASGSITINH